MGNCHSQIDFNELEKQLTGVFYKMVVLKNLRKFAGISFFDFTNKNTPSSMFSLQFSQIF